MTIALGQYYLNRELQKPQKTGAKYANGILISEEYTIGKKWDKAADLERIDKSLSPKWGYSAIAGTFFFGNGSKYTYTMSSDTWPFAKRTKNEKKKQHHGNY